MKKIQVVYKSVDELIPYANNPRNNDATVPKLEKAIKEFGFKNPIVIDGNDEIVCGHTRLRAAKNLKMKEVPCIVADDLTEEQIKAFRLADNKIQESSEWDFELLSEELSDIQDIDMGDFGFELQDDDFNETSVESDDVKEVKIDDKYCIIVECESEQELETTFNELQQGGYKCRISTL